MNFLGDVVTFFADGDTWTGGNGMLVRAWEHVAVSVIALVIALAIALPVALVLGHLHRASTVAINVSNVGRAIPSYAVLVIAVQAIGFGPTPTTLALVLLAVPPILTNTYVGISGIDPEIRESAVGMGLSGPEVLRRIELPLGIPLIMAGIRTAAVTVVATATLAAFIGRGGLGRFIVDGQAQQDDVEVFAGALAVAVLALLTELGLGALQRALTPKGLTIAARDEARPVATLADAAAS